MSAYPSRPDRSLADGTVPLDPSTYNSPAGYNGQMQHYLGRQLLGSPMYGQAPDNLRRLGMRGMFASGGELARDRFLMANPQLLQQQVVAGAQRKLGYR